MVRTHVSLLHALSVHVRYGQVTIAHRHWHGLSLLVLHRSIRSMHLLGRCLTGLRRLSVRRSLVVGRRVRNTLLCTQHLRITLLLRLNHLLTALAGLLGELKIQLETSLTPFLWRLDRDTLLWSLVLLR